MSVSPAVLRRLMRELSELQNSPPEGIRVVVNEDNMLDVTGIIEGPEGTPYAGGYFRVKFKFTEEFPAAPPKCWFATKIFHPNVSSAGEICVNTLKKDWKSSYGIGHILVTVKCLLIYPNPESALDEEAGKLLLENYDSYCDRAKLITSVHATPKVRPSEFDTPSSEGSATEPSTSKSSTSISTASTTTSAYISAPSVPGVKLSTSASGVFTTSPLKTSASNLSTSSSEASLGPEKGSGKERMTSPSPLGLSDSNVAANTTSAATKAIKRGAATGTTGAEKRKKALKRL
ncbi:ubiquitin-conjugating enzyme/RWD-like protein [Abortiporus biennis]|nr:ubiquitin-conjugating enzyme/RWD-like protein [Abortiporus biennis]